MTNECVQCGFCCMQGPCPFGVWDATAHRCKFLTKENLCGIYEKIKRVAGSEDTRPSGPAVAALSLQSEKG